MVQMCDSYIYNICTSQHNNFKNIKGSCNRCLNPGVGEGGYNTIANLWTKHSNTKEKNNPAKHGLRQSSRKHKR